MNKDWEDDFDEKYWNEEFGASRIKNFIEKELAKQRTQLLARVREEVMGQVYCTTSDNCGTCNVVRQQLKKLEIISEEGK